jgi:hypothetical protein
LIPNGNQNHKYKTCGRQFVEAPRQKIISEETKALIDKLLLDGNSHYKNDISETLTQRGFNNYLQICKSLKARRIVP